MFSQGTKVKIVIPFLKKIDHYLRWYFDKEVVKYFGRPRWVPKYGIIMHWNDNNISYKVKTKNGNFDIAPQYIIET